VELFEGFLNTQPLWKQEQFGLQQFRIPEVDLNTFKAKPIAKTIRLGHQVEFVFLQLLDAHPDYEIIAHSIQIKKGNKTIGELDFLIKHKQQVYHIELSCKFYLVDPTISEPIHRLVGPNRGDMFFTKLDKTKDQQLPLLYTKECLRELQALNIHPDQVVQQVYFAAQLFVPITGALPSIRPLNKQCITGSWVGMQDFEGESFRESVYYIPFKNEWLHLPHGAVNWQSHFETLLEINVRHLNKKSPMLWRKLPDGSLDKFFVVWW